MADSHALVRDLSDITHIPTEVLISSLETAFGGSIWSAAAWRRGEPFRSRRRNFLPREEADVQNVL